MRRVLGQFLEGSPDGSYAIGGQEVFSIEATHNKEMNNTKPKAEILGLIFDDKYGLSKLGYSKDSKMENLPLGVIQELITMEEDQH